MLHALLQQGHGVPHHDAVCDERDSQFFAGAVRGRPRKCCPKVVEFGGLRILLADRRPLVLLVVLKSNKEFEQRFGVPAQRCICFPRLAESFERVRARGFEQPVARHRIALSEHQRLVHKRPQMIKRRPCVDARILRDVLRRLQREAAGEHAEPAQHRSRARGEHPEALVQARAQSFHAEQGHARGGELDRQRNPIEPAADFDHRLAVFMRQRKARIDALHPREEQLHCARIHGIGARVGRGHVECAQSVDLFVSGLQGFLAGREDAQTRGFGARNFHQ